MPEQDTVDMELIMVVNGKARSTLRLNIEGAPLSLVRQYQLGLIKTQKEIIEAQG